MANSHAERDHRSAATAAHVDRRFHARLDALSLTTAEQDDVVSEARLGFARTIALSDELAADHGLG